MGLDYSLRCEKCWDEWAEADKLCEMKGNIPEEPEFDLNGYINVDILILWLIQHSAHSKIRFVIV